MTTFNVSNASQLNSALREAGSGDRIVLDSGNYGSLSLNGDKGITLASSSGGNPAVFSRVVMENVSDITMQGLKFSGGGDGMGLKVFKASDVTVENSEFSGYRRGAYFSRIDGLKVTGNDFERMDMDSAAFGGVSDVLIANNDFRNLQSNPNILHKDVIQFWSSGSEGPSRNVTIRDNYMESSDKIVHGIFIANPAANGNSSKFHRNILIEDNTVNTSHSHGITVDETIGVTIRNNKVANGALINVDKDSQDVTISGNSTSGKNSIEGYYGNSSNSNTNNFLSSTDSDIDPDTDIDTGTDTDTGTGGGQVHFSGDSVEGTERDRVAGIDFEDGDQLILVDYDQDTFQDRSGGNAVQNSRDGSDVEIDSVLDLAELAAISPDIKGEVGADDALIVTINQNDGTHVLTLENLGSEFEAVADRFDLF